MKECQSFRVEDRASIIFYEPEGVSKANACYGARQTAADMNYSVWWFRRVLERESAGDLRKSGIRADRALSTRFETKTHTWLFITSQLEIK